jgi:hypothetical protein
VLPVFVGVIDIAGVLGGASGVLQLDPRVAAGDPFALELPAWGTTHAVGRLNPVAVVFLAWYAAYARRFGVDRRSTGVALTAALLLSLVWAVASGGAVPVLALLGAAPRSVRSTPPRSCRWTRSWPRRSSRRAPATSPARSCRRGRPPRSGRRPR